MRRHVVRTGSLLALVCACGESPIPVETEVLLINFTSRWYAVFELERVAPAAATERTFVSPLMPPGAALRKPFQEVFPFIGGCPDLMNVRIYLYKRVRDHLPIGEDPAESDVVQPALASQEFRNVSVCESSPVRAEFTIVLRESAEGAGVVKFKVPIDREACKDDVSFPDTGHCVFEGAELERRDSIPPLQDAAPLQGKIVMPDGTPLEGVGIILRTRVRIDEDPMPPCCADQPTSLAGLEGSVRERCCLSLPIDTTRTLRDGSFRFDRPPGTYFIEAIADDLEFRPPAVFVTESPIDNIIILAEPIP